MKSSSQYKLRTILIVLFVAVCTSFSVFAQNHHVFDDTVLTEVHITINPDSLDAIFSNKYSYHEYPANFEFIKNGVSETVDSVGFRLRGNTSRDSQKKSFKVAFNGFEKGKQFHGLDKLNLNGEHNDPTIMRAKLSWFVFDKVGINASKAAHTKLYINGQYYGLYINVEHIDDKFVKNRFDGELGNLYKNLYPADLTYMGSHPNTYRDLNSNGRPYYELKTNKKSQDFSDLAVFIEFLNKSGFERFKNEIEDYLDVDALLQWMAVDILTGNWDNYWYNKNNYYLYHEFENNRFVFLPYDYDNTFGIDFVGVDWAKHNLNNWGPNESRPLVDRVLEVDEYKNRLHFYINKFIDEFFNEDVLFPEIDRIYQLTKAAAEEDTYRTKDYGYSIEKYHRSFNESLGAHAQYGLKPYITMRVQYALNQLDLQNISPIFQKVEREFDLHSDKKELAIKATVIDEDEQVEVKAVFPDYGHEITLVYGGDNAYLGNYSLAGFNGKVNYYLEATDSKNQVTRYPNNPNKTLSLNLPNTENTIVINEFMASNKTTIPDDTGEYVDYIEIYNNGSTTSLKDYYLTDNFSKPDKWAFPDIVIPSQSYLLIWADSSPEKGPLHAAFGLSKNGEEVAIFKKHLNNFTLIDSVSFGPLDADEAFGRFPNGTGPFQVLDSPSPGESNDNPTANEKEDVLPQKTELYQNYPNPFNPETIISFYLQESDHILLEIYTISGQLVTTLVDQTLPPGHHAYRFNADHLSSGVYFYRFITKDEKTTHRMMLIK